MSANFPRRRRPAGTQQAPPRRRGDETRLWNIGVALAVSLTVAVVGLAGLAWLAWTLLGLAGYRRHGPPPLHDAVGVAQLIFASVAGAGALVALVVGYRRQKVAETDSIHDRIRVFNERFATAASQLGADQPAVRLAGVHAMAGLADDWEENRQTCIDVLCAYLRLPNDPDPGGEAEAERTAYAARAVRTTILRLISTHLRPSAAVPWTDRDFDFTEVVIDSSVSFEGAQFSGGRVSFEYARFSGGEVSFNGARFSGDQVSFEAAEFSGGVVSFTDAEFSGGLVYFSGARFSGGLVDFNGARFSGGQVDFNGAKFSSELLSFEAADFSGDQVNFRGAGFSGQVDFTGANFTRAQVNFIGAGFSGQVDFTGAKFSGSEVNFAHAEFTGSQVNFRLVADWSQPPVFAWGDKAPPPEVQLPPQR